jgi:TolB-like protein
MRRTKTRVCLLILLCLNVTTPAARAQEGLNKRVDELAQQIAAKMTARQKTTVAVVEFTDLQGRTTDFGRFLAEELITRLMETEKFRVIERQLLNKVISEQKLSLTGVVDPASAKQLGKILGVEAVVAGTVTNLSQSVKVNARLISTETGEIFAVASAEIFKDESVTSLLAGSGAPAGSVAPKPTPESTTPNKTSTQRVQDFVFELNSCKMAGDSVTCYLTIRNDLNEDRQLWLYHTSSRLFDEAGNEYRGSEGKFGSRSGGGLNNYVLNVLVSQVPTNASVRFKEVSEQATRATLSLSVQGANSRAVAITFRNIQITR